MYTIVLEYDDGRQAVTQRHVVALAEAVIFALGVADRVGAFKGDGHGPPRWVKIYRGDNLEIAISVLSGGLTGAPASAEREAVAS